ncbi:MAG: catechol 1,2-dioxygenase [Cyclobacteriaceae bacterium]
MKRRAFTKLTGLSAIAISTTGFVSFNGNSYVGDCETTTDILGPFYRPNSPVRSNLIIKELQGDVVELSGVIRNEDCTTAMKGVKVELWHCSADQVYDNESDEFRYRGTVLCDHNGKYSFLTQMPVPYDVGGGVYRPAHFHIMFSAEGHQSLITQIYFTGDPYLMKDSSSSADEAQGRILEVREFGGAKRVSFDINMNKKLSASYGALNKLVGKYRDLAEDMTIELFQYQGTLWEKNEVFGQGYEYVGNNIFTLPGSPKGSYKNLRFDLQEDGTKLKIERKWRGEDESVKNFVKLKI